ncbi:MAG: helix-turn-helix domain-containing protein [Pseudolabrys sp.]|nr:helix-turn-helix domain-containing protein [Pseudolabrys sp.]
MSAKSWSTDNVRPIEGLSFWRDVVCEAVLNVSPKAPSASFRASLSGQVFGPLRFASFTSTPHFIEREKTHVNRAADDHYLISLQRSGHSHMEQGGDPVVLEPGEIGIIDGTRPFRVTFPDEVSRILAVVPRHRIEAQAPWLRGGASLKIAASSPYADLARLHLAALAAGSVDVRQAELLTDNLCNLLALATAGITADPDMRTDTQMQAILNYCRQHLSDIELTPRAVAARFGISVRTLHLRFETMGLSFGRWLLESRLQECRRALSDPALRARTISQIAYDAGFGDLSHFSKAFRARFGEAPRDLRHMQ